MPITFPWKPALWLYHLFSRLQTGVRLFQFSAFSFVSQSLWLSVRLCHHLWSAYVTCSNSIFFSFTLPEFHGFRRTPIYPHLWKTNSIIYNFLYTSFVFLLFLIKYAELNSQKQDCKHEWPCKCLAVVWLGTSIITTIVSNHYQLQASYLLIENGIHTFLSKNSFYRRLLCLFCELGLYVVRSFCNLMQV